MGPPPPYRDHRDRGYRPPDRMSNPGGGSRSHCAPDVEDSYFRGGRPSTTTTTRSSSNSGGPRYNDTVPMNNSRRGYNVVDTNKKRQHRDRDDEEEYYDGRRNRHRSNSRSSGDNRYGYYSRERQPPQGRGYDGGPRRDRDDSRYRHSTSSRERELNLERGGEEEYQYSYEQSDWQCEECSRWNYPDELRCSRCGLKGPTVVPPPEGVEQDSQNKDGSDHDEGPELDDFGRRKIRKKTDQHEWPPVFEKDSVNFVFDARSGMFYEATSDFFYDPNSKLYYSNRKKAYFAYNMETKTFVPVDASGNEVADHTQAQVLSDDADKHDELLLVPNAKKKSVPEPSKNAISIKLKTAVTAGKVAESKKKKKRSNSDAKAEPAKAPKTTSETVNTASGPPKLATKVQKEQIANLEKWSERQQEVKSELGASGNDKLPIRKTAEGKPVCMICKRKFPTLDKLRLHEEKSALHKENVKKQRKEEERMQVATKGIAAEVGTGYVDRAAQRRDMYGPDHVFAPSFTATGEDAKDAAPIANPAAENSTANEDPLCPSKNIGHQMLQKMGFNGKNLGRGTEQQQVQQAALAQDWERIESLASKPQR